MHDAIISDLPLAPKPALTIGSGKSLCRCDRPHRIIIIGAGVAGLSAAIWLRRFGLSPLVLEQACSLGGLLRSLDNMIPDCPGLPAVSGHTLADRLVRHAHVLDVDIRQTFTVDGVDPELAELATSSGTMCYDALIITTGSRNRQLGVPGEREMMDRRELPSADADPSAFAGQGVAVIGGGDRALEESLILADAGARVILVHRSTNFRAQERFIRAAKAHPRIDIIAPATVCRIIGQESVCGIEIVRSGMVSTLNCAALFIRVGVVGNAEFAAEAVDRDPYGFIVVDSNHQTSQPGIWAIGDVAAPAAIRSISTAMGQAALVAKQLSLQHTSVPQSRR